MYKGFYTSKDGRVETGSVVRNEQNLLSIESGQVNLGDYGADNCVTNPEKCGEGIAVSFWLRHKGRKQCFE